jgi:hypothetical protein
MKKEDGLLDGSKRFRYFWLCAALLALFHTFCISYDIKRPFCGLHSWAQASGSWVARTHLKYGYGYTKGVSTWAVGDPPKANPTHYLNHPQLGGNLDVLPMLIFGINEWSFRLFGIFLGVGTILIFLRTLRGLTDDFTTLLAGLIFVMFPLNAYFGMGGWFALFAFLGLWCYLVIIKVLKGGPEPGRIHKVGLALTLFLMLQLSWTGFFYAFAFGSHYVLFELLGHKRRPDFGLLAILVLAPLASCAITFTIMAAGYGWDLSKIVELYKWRASKGEVGTFSWGLWFSEFWQKAVTNFTMPALFAAIIYITVGQFFVLRSGPSKKKAGSPLARWRFPQLWLFLIPGVTLLLVFRGLVWRHEYWQRSLAVFIAIAAALFIMLAADLLRRVSRHLAIAWVVVVTGGYVALAGLGIEHYYGIRWQPEEKIAMLKLLNEKIPPDKYLLSYDPFMTDQHESKGAFYRPEVAWYLDREITSARSETLEEIQKFAATGKYPCYLVPEPPQFSTKTRSMYIQSQDPTLDPVKRQRLKGAAEQAVQQEYMKWMSFIESLKRTYKYQRVEGVKGEYRKPYPLAKKEIFFRAGMEPQLIFDLNSPAQAQAGNSPQ